MRDCSKRGKAEEQFFASPIDYRISLQNEPHLLKRVGFVLQKVFFLLCQPRRQGAIGAVSDACTFKRGRGSENIIAYAVVPMYISLAVHD